MLSSICRMHNNCFFSKQKFPKNILVAKKSQCHVFIISVTGGVLFNFYHHKYVSTHKVHNLKSYGKKSFFMIFWSVPKLPLSRKQCLKHYTECPTVLEFLELSLKFIPLGHVMVYQSYLCVCLVIVLLPKLSQWGEQSVAILLISA